MKKVVAGSISKLCHCKYQTQCHQLCKVLKTKNRFEKSFLYIENIEITTNTCVGLAFLIRLNLQSFETKAKLATLFRS